MPPAASASPIPAPVPKVLRVGLVRDGQVVRQRLLRAGETATIGVDATLEVPELPGRRPLLVWDGRGYQLDLPPGATGRLQTASGHVDVGPGRTPVHADVRGKLVLGDAVVLFQFVDAPPEPARAVDFRPRLLDDEDPLFLGLLGVFTIAAAAFSVYVATSTLPPSSPLDEVADAIPVNLPRVVLPPPTPALQVPRPAPAPHAAPGRTIPATEAHPLTERAIGTHGASAVADLFPAVLDEDDTFEQDLDRAVAGVTGVTSAATSAPDGWRSTRHDADAHVGPSVGTVRSAGAATGGPPVTVHLRMTSPPPRSDAPSGDIAPTVRAARGAVEGCVETALARNPSLAGRLAFGWTVAHGRVEDVHVLQALGDADLTRCMTNVVGRLRFGPEVSATVDSYAWDVSGL